MQVRCERVPPEGWPGGPCESMAVFDVLYRLRVEQEPRGIRLCMAHFEELKELKLRGMIADWDARAIR